MSATGFALTNIMIRKGVRPGDADNGVLITTIVNVIIFWAVAGTLGVLGRLPVLNLTGVLLFVLAGVLTTFLGRNTLFGGIRLIGSSRAASIKNTNPIVSVAIAILFLGEYLSPLAVAGATLSFVGLMLLVFEAYQSRQAERIAEKAASEKPKRSTALLGTSLAVLAAIFFGSGQAVRKVGLEYLPNVFLGVAIGSLTALVFYITMTGARGKLSAALKTSFGSFRPYFWLAGLGSTVGQFGFFAAVWFAPLSQVTVITSSETILTLILAAIFLGNTEIINRTVMLAAAAVFAGAILISIA